ncbi:LysR family transcriptional regulator [Brevibacterium zhoupengii]|uniref:LysR family transcriptional regulator n=1 Tax=Brevibacterium zhoupengii TaxID=2898795 RepID=UPI001E41EAF7|nr:LysR family transcriptional regulator [Brevibacterium zhoupengii]
MKFDLHRLRLLSELSQRGTVSSVAEDLSYSTSAVSQQLAALEKEIGVPLLVPDGRRVKLTPQAEILVRHTSELIKQLDQAEAEIVTSLATVAGTVRLAAVQTAALARVPEMLHNLSESHPALKVHLTQAEPDVALPALLAREFDLVCVEEFDGMPTPRSKETHSETVVEDPMRVAFRDLPVGKVSSDVVLKDFADQPWVLEPEGSPVREWAVAVCRKAGFEPRVEHETSDTLVACELVRYGRAVAFLPDLIWSIREPEFHLRLMDPAHTRTLLTRCRIGAQSHPIITTVREAYREVFALAHSAVDR